MKRKPLSALLVGMLALSITALGTSTATGATYSYNGKSCTATPSSTLTQAIVKNGTCHRVVAQIKYRHANGSTVTVTGTASATKSVATASNGNIVGRAGRADLGNGTTTAWYSF